MDVSYSSLQGPYFAGLIPKRYIQWILITGINISEKAAHCLIVHTLLKEKCVNITNYN